jgi:transcriptional regulator with XRE-family HTH domain
MAEDLWNLRKRRGMTVKQLANKSGVPALSIEEYERGEPIRIADLARLARALFVDEFDIKIQSDPKPDAPAPRPPHPERTRPQETPTQTRPTPPARPPKPSKPAPNKPAVMARPTQIEHLMNLAELLGEDEAAVLATAGKPLDQLNRQEASQLLKQYQERVKEYRLQEEENRPPGTRRKRAHLPEGIDEFELNYLRQCQEAGDQLSFTLLNGQSFTGRVQGFSPYFITIEQPDGTETNIHKLALAYYQRRPAGEEAA